MTDLSAVVAQRRAALILEAMLALQRDRGRLRHVTVDDVALVLAAIDGALGLDVVARPVRRCRP